MTKYQRTRGKKAGAKAALHEYAGKTAKLEIEMPIGDAARILDAAIAAGGRLPATLSINGNLVNVSAVGARIDSYDENGKRIGGSGVVGFASLENEPE